jgi:LacI family transcriptional regulator
MNAPHVEKSRPTHREIARVAQVSGATVSLALRNHPTIPAKTCRRIQRIAERLGYRPDPHLNRLMAHVRRSKNQTTTSTIGFLTAYERKSPWKQNVFLRRIYDGVVARADRLGFRIEEHWLTEPGMSAERLRHILVARGVEGLLVLGTPTWVQTLGFDFTRFACATIGYSVRLPFHRACQHQYQEMFSVLQKLEALGYKRPGLVLSEDTDHRTLHHYSAAFLWWQQQWPTPRRVPTLTAEPVEAGVFGAWFDRYRPDVVIAQTPGSPVVIEWLRRLGAQVPLQCGFVSLDVDLSLPVKCSGIRQDYESVAGAALDLVAGQLLRGERGLPEVPKITLMEGVWIEGATTASPPHPS